MPRETSLSGRKITILGAGISGIALAKLASRLGASVFLSEARDMTADVVRLLEAKGIVYEAGGHTDRALACDEAVVGSGFPPTAKVVARLRERGVPLVGELDFVLPYLPGRLIGVTGSNGKTTTTSLIGHLLESAGVRAATAGNIGSPIADFACEDYDCIVAELSSFQLHWSQALAVDAAIVTNIAPDHIDWHGSFENYVSAKASLLPAVKEGGAAIMQERDMELLGAGERGTYALAWGKSSRGNAVILDRDARSARLRRPSAMETHLFDFTDTKLLGDHNMENVAMAMSALCLLGVELPGVLPALATYVPPPHRCAFVAEIGGVSYVDDSKGTNVAATVTALASLPKRKVVILGGRGKGEDYSPLADALRKSARCAVLLGEAAPDIASALGASGYDDFWIVPGMEEAVLRAAEKALPGDMVLLSPACTSWDMYKNYGERGDHFAALVRRRLGGGE